MRYINQRLFFFSIVFMLLFNGKTYEESVIERLNIPVKVCLEGEDCGSSAEMQSSNMTNTNNEVKKVQLSEGNEHTIKMLNMGDGGQMIFEPAVIKVSIGDTIHFKAVDLSHNSATVDGMIPAGASPWFGEINQDISVTLETEGVYVYQCDPHAMMAMIGVIQVGEATNMNEIRNASDLYKSTFIMNAERINNYLDQL
tara:strand:+ start:4437 stop:5030 length:594 start_codon:yes stop_codon:yes gene_type:complete